MAIGATVWMRRMREEYGPIDDSRLLLLIGLYFSILPMTTVTHRHTYLFLLPTYALIYSLITRTINSCILVGFKSGSILIYLWLSQSIVATILDKIAIGIPSIVLEEAFPNLALVLLIILAICFYERSEWLSRNAPSRTPREKTA